MNGSTPRPHTRIAGALLALAGALSGACGAPAPSTPIEHVILISIDTLRADYLEPYGAPTGLTPNVAEFAAGTIVFDDAITQATSTLPSHTSLFYSVHSFVHRAYTGNPPDPQLPSPVGTLRDAGFRTAAFVGGGQLRPRFGLDRGFDTYEIVDTRNIGSDNRDVDRLGNLLTATDGFLREHGRDPFFLFLHTYEPHLPYAPPAAFLSQVSAIGADGIGADLDAPLVEYTPDAGVPEGAWIADDSRRLYAAEVAYVDDFLGKLFALLDQMALTDNTLIVLTSDHGESLGERGLLGHNLFYTEQLRVPLLIRVPGLAAGRSDAPVQLIDVMPTLYALLDVDPPYPFMGTDLGPLLRGDPATGPDRVRFSENKGFAAVLQGPWKVVFALREHNNFQLFNLAADPGELHDLANERAARAAQLIRKYDGLVAANATLMSLFPRRGEEAAQALDEETRRELRALGYIQ